jgi:hypothetical protein
VRFWTAEITLKMLAKPGVNALDCYKISPTVVRKLVRDGFVTVTGSSMMITEAGLKEVTKSKEMEA